MPLFWFRQTIISIFFIIIPLFNLDFFFHKLSPFIELRSEFLKIRDGFQTWTSCKLSQKGADSYQNILKQNFVFLLPHSVLKMLTKMEDYSGKKNKVLDLQPLKEKIKAL